MKSFVRGDEPLVRAIGTLALAAGIVNITIGGGIFRLPSIVAASLGPAAPLAYIVCAAAMGLIVLCMADAGRRVSLTGGPYAYVGAAFGPYAGFVTGVLLWMLGSFAGAAVTTVLAASVIVRTARVGSAGGVPDEQAPSTAVARMVTRTGVVRFMFRQQVLRAGAP